MSYASFQPKLWIIALVCLVIGSSAATAFAWSNTASKTIALATAALWGATCLFGLQLFLELRASEDSDFVSVEFTVDRAKPSVWGTREPVLQGFANMRQFYEHGASEWLAKNSPKVFSEDRDRLTRHFALAEILLFFSWQEFDWRVATTPVVGSRLRSVTVLPALEKGNNCTEVRRPDFAAALGNAGNVLAGFDVTENPDTTDKALLFLRRPVCFPPGTEMILTDNSLTLSNPFGSLQFIIVPPGPAVSLNPERNEREVQEPSPPLPNGEPQFEMRIFGIRIVNRQNALYSQHRDAAKQATWRKRVISGLHSWFEQPRAGN